MSIPLKAKVAIRDSWDNPESSVRQSIRVLKSTLGIDVRCEPDWPVLVAELDAAYDDRQQLVGYVTGSLAVLFEMLNEVLEDESHAEWTDALLDWVKGVSSDLKVVVTVLDRSIAPSVNLSETHRGIVVSLPNIQCSQPAEFNHVFKDQLLSLFDKNKQPASPTVAIPIRSTTGDDWADVGAATEDVEIKTAAGKVSANIAGTAEVQYLPDPDALPKPDTLLRKAPYHLLIHTFGKTHMEMSCSHAPTLGVLYKYLKKWCRTNPNRTNKPPAISIIQNQTSTAFGTGYDTLTLEADGHFTISPALILNLVEGVLGYRRVSGETSAWHYQRDTPFQNA